MAIVPTLHSGPVSILKNDQDIIAYLIRHSLKNPGFISSFLNHKMISFRDLESRYGKDKNRLADAYEQALAESLTNLFPDKNYIPEVETEDIDGFHYALYVNVKDTNGITILVSGKIDVYNDKIDISFNNQ